ncbi:MAG: hypothetical protein H0V24_15210, partial [Chloroflexia bacterium]|nr:hypothetical protein [Chloroflexia bacterium]
APEPVAVEVSFPALDVRRMVAGTFLERERVELSPGDGIGRVRLHPGDLITVGVILGDGRAG